MFDDWLRRPSVDPAWRDVGLERQAALKERTLIVRARSRAFASSYAVCIPSQVSALEPKALESRMAISTETPAFPFKRSESACRVTPNPSAASVTERHWQLLPNQLSIGGISEDRPMPTRNVSLTPEQDAFIDEVLEKGEYRNASEAMRDAIRALQQRRAEEALKLDRLRLSIKQGVAALDRGDYTEVEDENLDAFLDDLAAPARR
jgi:antitoxin ParD1/3/4